MIGRRTVPVRKDGFVYSEVRLMVRVSYFGMEMLVRPVSLPLSRALLWHCAFVLASIGCMTGIGVMLFSGTLPQGSFGMVTALLLSCAIVGICMMVGWTVFAMHLTFTAAILSLFCEKMEMPLDKYHDTIDRAWVADNLAGSVWVFEAIRSPESYVALLMFSNKDDALLYRLRFG